ncbi:hypothetical protein [Streptomyces huiliensis]|uniref:hypothetical protein n=1 Tax=Streptomyces huiliensis TaxID=2876027 RepID=UPI001CBAC574|nr:hypothetical protein [Streptomyces huiliensis]MBZ4318367.1 hypothetical protein [Streptomyces huiliensis]
MRLRHTAVGALVVGFVLAAAPTAPAAIAKVLPAGCTSTQLASGGVHIVCTEGLRSYDEPLNGTDKADIIEVRGGDAVSGHLSGAVNGLGGDDVITVDRILAGGSGGDVRGSVDGGDGDDEITVTDRDSWSVQGTVRGGAGNDTVTTGEVSFRGRVEGGAGDDAITTGGVFSATIDGGDGNDTLHVAAFRVPGYDKTNRLDGGSGDDTISVGTLAGPVRGGLGEDEITVDGTLPVESRLPKPATVDGDEGDDVIRVKGISVGSAARATYVSGGAGGDLIEVPSAGQEGYATLSGDDDDDVIQGPGGTAVVLGPYGTVDGGKGDNLCRTDNSKGGTVTNCRS